MKLERHEWKALSVALFQRNHQYMMCMQIVSKSNKEVSSCHEGNAQKYLTSKSTLVFFLSNANARGGKPLYTEDCTFKILKDFGNREVFLKVNTKLQLPAKRAKEIIRIRHLKNFV